MYEDNKQLLEELRTKNKNVVDKEFDKFVKNLENDIKEEDKKIDYNLTSNKDFLDRIGITEHKEIFYQILIYFGMLAFAAIMLVPNNLENIAIFLFGLVFFVAGFNIATSEDGKGFGIIFFFSHGGSGITLMIGSLLANRYSYEMLSDMNFNLKLYISLTVALLIFTVFATIIYNLSNTINKNKNNIIILLLLFFAILVLVGFMPIIRF